MNKNVFSYLAEFFFAICVVISRIYPGGYTDTFSFYFIANKATHHTSRILVRIKSVQIK